MKALYKIKTEYFYRIRIYWLTNNFDNNFIKVGFS